MIEMTKRGADGNHLTAFLYATGPATGDFPQPCQFGASP